MPILSVRISSDLHEQFVKLCEKRDTTATDLLRLAIEAFVDRAMEPNQPTPLREAQAFVTDISRRAAAPKSGVRGFAALSGEELPKHRGPIETVGKRDKTARK